MSRFSFIACTCGGKSVLTATLCDAYADQRDLRHGEADGEGHDLAGGRDGGCRLWQPVKRRASKQRPPVEDRSAARVERSPRKGTWPAGTRLDAGCEYRCSARRLDRSAVRCDAAAF